MRHSIAAMLAILAITLTVYYVTGGPAPSGSVTGQFTADATAQGSLLLASGFVPAQSLLVVRDGAIVFDQGTVAVVTVDLVGSDATDAVFRIQKTDASAVVYGLGQVLPTKRGAEGGLYAVVSASDLASIRSASGAGRYVFTVEPTRGMPLATAIVLG